jgi:hypothetical protein
VDFVDVEDVAGGRLGSYSAAILPVPLALDPSYFRLLTEYVRAGGALISDACPGRFDSHGWCPRAQMVDGAEELFGAVHADVRLVGEPPGKTVHWTPGMRGASSILPPTVLEGDGLLKGAGLRASFYVQTLNPVSGEPILRMGDQVAGVRNRFGQGTAVLLGTFAGHCATAHEHPESDEVLRTLLNAAGARSDRVGGLLRRRRVHGNREAWFLLNPTGDTLRERVELNGYAWVDDVTGDTVNGRDREALDVAIPPGNVGCVVVEKV